VSITVIAVPDPPVALDDSDTTSEDTAVTIDVAANDSDVDGNLDPASANTACGTCSNPANGGMVNNGDGSFTYTPNLGFVGNDSFVYEICDMGGLCDKATVNVTVSGQQSITTLYVTTSGGGNAGGITFKDEDILAYDFNTQTWSMYFDGSDVGLDASGQEIDAMHIEPDGNILLSLGTDVIDGTFPNISNVDDSDILRFIPTSIGDNTAGSYELYFDGSDVELTTSGEDVNGIGFAPDGRLVISPRGPFSVGGISGGDEDLLIFAATSLGDTTSGSWALYFDGSDVALDTDSGEDVTGTWIDGNGHIYLSTRGIFSVINNSVNGDGADIFTCEPGSTGDNTSCTFSLFWDGSANGLAGEVINGFFLGP
jgi:hypothetical protein